MLEQAFSSGVAASNRSAPATFTKYQNSYGRQNREDDADDFHHAPHQYGYDENHYSYDDFNEEEPARTRPRRIPKRPTNAITTRAAVWSSKLPTNAITMRAAAWAPAPDDDEHDARGGFGFSAPDDDEHDARGGFGFSAPRDDDEDDDDENGATSPPRARPAVFPGASRSFATAAMGQTVQRPGRRAQRSDAVPDAA